MQILIVNLSDLMGFSRKTVWNYYKGFRYISLFSFEAEIYKLRSEGIIIEIDESLFGKINYNKEKELKRSKFFVSLGKERDSNITLLIPFHFII